MELHPHFPTSPYAPLLPEQRWFPADEALRSTAYEKLLPPLVAKVRKEVFSWRDKGYPGASATSVCLLRHWFDTEHLLENADGSLSPFVETKGRAELDLPRKMARLRDWCADATAAEAAEGGRDGHRYDFVFVDQEGFAKHAPTTFAALAASFTDYKG